MYQSCSSSHWQTFIQVFVKKPESMGGTDVAEGEVTDFGRNASDASATMPDNTLKRSLKPRHV